MTDDLRIGHKLAVEERAAAYAFADPLAECQRRWPDFAVSALWDAAGGSRGVFRAVATWTRAGKAPGLQSAEFEETVAVQQVAKFAIYLDECGNDPVPATCYFCAGIGRWADGRNCTYCRGTGKEHARVEVRCEVACCKVCGWSERLRFLQGEPPPAACSRCGALVTRWG